MELGRDSMSGFGGPDATGPSYTGGTPPDPLPPRPAWGDPWPHEHGEHPSGVSVPDHAVGVHHQEFTHLIGDPVVVDGRHDHSAKVRTRVLLASTVAAVAAAVAFLAL